MASKVQAQVIHSSYSAVFHCSISSPFVRHSLPGNPIGALPIRPPTFGSWVSLNFPHLDLGPMRAHTQGMSDRSSRRPRDPNQLAYRIIQEATGQVPKYDPREESKPVVDPSKNPHAVALGRLGGLVGGVARAAKLSPKKRSQIAAKAANTRWGKKSK